MKITKYDKSFGLFIRARDNNICQVCKIVSYDGSELHCSHYGGRSNQSTRYDEENVDLLCHRCHAHFESKKGTSYREWKVNQLGERKVTALEKRIQEVKKWKHGEKEAMHKSFLKRTGEIYAKQ